MTDSRPIGILDSGFGGLSVMKAVRAELPGENLLFAADCGFAPWGDRTDAFINGRVDALVSFLLQNGIKALVLACNTATAVAAARLRAELTLPIIGIEPALLPAARETKSNVVGMMATTKTVKSEKYRLLKTKVPARVRVIDCPCPGLMDCVEEGEFDSPQTDALVAHYVRPLVAEGADMLVLGCTHYPFLAGSIRRAAGSGVTLIDPAPAVARELRRRLTEANLLSDRAAGKEAFYVTGATPERERVLQTLWKKDAALGALDV